MATAVLYDGSFFLKRYRKLSGPSCNYTPYHIAKLIFILSLLHLRKLKKDNLDLYRIFYYDCKPFDKKVHHPLSGRCIDFSKTPEAIFRNDLFEELKKKRKVALRLGHIKSDLSWTINPGLTKDLLKGKIPLSSLKEDDIKIQMRQKTIDLKIGVDITHLAYKKLVDTIILVAGDGDFVPAAKIARREGIDFILDPMWNPIDNHLFEHIDGIQTVFNRY